ncbi:hypothetical protein B0A56_08295 [Flavobacterium columnare NBRC 100251 = ATCC 23463]|nr:hypothetical protein AWN65_02110 [Flavobacterium covae]OXA78702.1 hypothetical protein B0A56_08295 [Flavobacterium columnare NBRC 100251 = ATCC 23463]
MYSITIIYIFLWAIFQTQTAWYSFVLLLLMHVILVPKIKLNRITKLIYLEWIAYVNTTASKLD